MTQQEFNRYLEPIYNAVDRIVPTNNKLVKFVDAKTAGEGIKKSLNKVKFIEKSERSSKQLIDLTLLQFKKHLKDCKITGEDEENLINAATDILEDAREKVEEVYSEIHVKVIENEIRTDCINNNYKRLESLNDLQNEIVAKEIFKLAMTEIEKRTDKNAIDNIFEEFRKIYEIAAALFNAVALNGNQTSKL